MAERVTSLFGGHNPTGRPLICWASIRPSKLLTSSEIRQDQHAPRACGRPTGPARERGRRTADRPRSACQSYSGHDEIRDEDFSLGLRSEQQCDDKARRSDAGADQHRDCKAEPVMTGEPGKNKRNKAAEDRSLVIAEGARRRPHLGREAFRKIGGVLAI